MKKLIIIALVAVAGITGGVYAMQEPQTSSPDFTFNPQPYVPEQDTKKTVEKAETNSSEPVTASQTETVSEPDPQCLADKEADLKDVQGYRDILIANRKGYVSVFARSTVHGDPQKAAEKMDAYKQISENIDRQQEKIEQIKARDC